MKITVNEQTLEQFLKTGSNLLVVPDYQRPYSWRNEQLENLWDDLVSLDLGSDEMHFIGSIVLISKTNRPGDFNELEVVDGQQRLTALSILIKSIMDKCGSEEDEEISLKDFLFTRVLRRGKRVKLQLGRADRDTYNNLINNSFNEIKSSAIYRTYEFFNKKLESLEEMDFDSLLNKIIYRLNFVVIFTDSDKSAYRLFETLNDRGLDLSAVDLIKNHLFKITSEKELDLELIKDAWEEIIENLEGIDKVRYFRHYLLSSGVYGIRGKITKEGLYDKFCDVLDKMNNIKSFVEDIKKQSVLYAKISNASYDALDRSKDEKINKHLKNLSAIRATTSYTFLLKVFNKLETAEDIVKLLKLLEVFAVRRNIVRVSTSDLDIIYNNLAIDAFEGGADWYGYVRDYLKKNLPSDNEFEEKFKSSEFQESNQTKYILDKIETDGYGAGNEGIVINSGFNVHIEHIAPKSMNDPSKWPGFSGLEIDKKNTYIKSIGNLTLLEKRPNIQASNSSFSDKKEFYNEENTDMQMTQELLNYDKWGIDEIKERSKKLAKKAVKIWSL